MSKSARGAEQASLVLRLSVPSGGALRHIAAEIANKVAAYLGSAPPRFGAESAGAILESLAARVAPLNGDADIAFEFHRRESALVMQARCKGRSSEAQYPLPD